MKSVLKNLARRFMAVFLAVAICIPLLNGIHIPTAQAAPSETFVKNVSNTQYSFGDMSDPDPHESDTEWNGSIIYFGKYDGQPVRYRVLSTSYLIDSTNHIGDGVLLDSEKVLFRMKYNANPRNNEWTDSDIRKALNGDAFLNKDGVFTDAEKSALISASLGDDEFSPDDWYPEHCEELYGAPVYVDGDKIFLLDFQDVYAYWYGYVGYFGLKTLKKTAFDGTYSTWWIRNKGNKVTTDPYIGKITNAGVMETNLDDGYGYTVNPVSQENGVAPALGINYSKVLFSSAVEGEFGKLDTAYKLTVYDDNLSFNVSNVSVNGNVVSFNYGVSGTDAGNVTQISYFILRKPCDNLGNNDLYAYGTATVSGGKASFAVPYSDLLAGQCGTDYFLYVTAEDINGKYETDYASNIVELSVDLDFSFVKNADNTRLGHWEIANPVIRTAQADAWHGSYVYYGKYDGIPVKYRVLYGMSSNGKSALLLDSDRVLFSKSYNTNPRRGIWAESSLRASLNGSGFLEKDGVFTAVEKEAIETTTKEGGAFTNGVYNKVPQHAVDLFHNSVGLDGDRIFLLDMQELCIDNNGYYNPFYASAGFLYNKKTTGDADSTWWLRNEGDYTTVTHPVDGEIKGYTAGLMEISDGDGYGYTNSFVQYARGVAPAFNVSYDKILLASAVRGEFGEADTEYKLTLSDSNINLAVSDVNYLGKKVSFNYRLSGSDADTVTQLSYLILRNPWSEYGYQNRIISYGAATVNGSVTGSTKASFTLPDGLPGRYGLDYYVYILAEDINGILETDYAGNYVLLPNPPESFYGKNASNTTLGADSIRNPRVPDSEDDFWQGSYIYYGKYNGSPLRFRVLDNATTVFGGNTVFLDSDMSLAGMAMPFDTAERNIWKTSSVRQKLNGNVFLTKDGIFTETERNVIAESTVAGHQLSGDFANTVPDVDSYTALNGDKIFLLDVEDLLNENYGYINAFHDPSKQTKSKEYLPYNWIVTKRSASYPLSVYWQRNAAGYTVYSSDEIVYWTPAAGTNSSRRGFENKAVVAKCDIAPAMNIDRDSVLLATAVYGSTGELGAEYKLTLLDPEINLSVAAATYTGNKVSFFYELSGSHKDDVTQLSYVITDGPMNSENAKILHYGKVTVDPSIYSGDMISGSFYLPGELAEDYWGSDYNVYLLAEDVNGTFETDYASEMTEIALSDLQVMYDLTKGAIRLNSVQKSAISYVLVEGLANLVQESDNAVTIDLDRNNSEDVRVYVQSNSAYMEKLSTCSIPSTYMYKKQQLNNRYAMVIFRVAIVNPMSKPKVDRHALSLSDEIMVRFGVSFPDDVDPEGSYVDFVSSDGRVGRMAVADAEKDTGDPSANRYYFAFNINALELSDEITATVHYGDGLTETDTYCAMDYIYTILHNADLYGEKVVNMVGALLDYGYYMQRSGWKDNGTHTEIAEPSLYLTDLDIADAIEGLSSYSVTKNLASAGIADARVAIALNSRTELKFYVKPAEGVSILTEGTPETLYGETYYMYSFKDIGPKNLDFEFTQKVKTDLGTAQVKASVLSYVNALIASGTMNKDQLRALTAYYYYYAAAEDY